MFPPWLPPLITSFLLSHLIPGLNWLVHCVSLAYHKGHKLMATNCLAPGYIKLFYSSNGHDHVQTIPVKPASVVANFHVLTKDGTNIDMAAAMTAFYAVWSPFFTADDALTGFEQFTQANCASAPVFQGNGELVGLVGTGDPPNVQWAQADFTFKSTLGGRGLFKLLEGKTVLDTKAALGTFTGDAIADMRDYLTGDASWFLCRDGGYLGVPLNYVTKVNDALRKKFLNP